MSFSRWARNGLSEITFSSPYTGLSTASATPVAVLASGTKPAFGTYPCGTAAAATSKLLRKSVKIFIELLHVHSTTTTLCQTHATVHVQDVAGDVAGFVAGEKDDCCGDVARLSHSAQRNPFIQFLFHTG